MQQAHTTAPPARDELDSGNAVGERAPAGAARRPRDLLAPAQVQAFNERSDLPGLLYFAAHYGLIGLTGWLLYVAPTGVATAAALVLHGVVLSYLFSPLHECAHGTAFRTRWLNEAVFFVTAFVYIVPPYWFRYFHLSHHRYTQIPGRDPDIVLQHPAGLVDWLVYVSGLPLWKRNLLRLIRHALGRADPSDPLGVMHTPRHLRTRILAEARVMLVAYGLVALVVSLTVGPFALLLYWWLPRLLGEPVQRMLRVAEHTGCAESDDLLANTRTTLTVWPLRLIGWQMPYHTEHHLFPNAPFHALPALHREIAPRLVNLERRGYLAGHLDILRTLAARRRQSA